MTRPNSIDSFARLPAFNINLVSIHSLNNGDDNAILQVSIICKSSNFYVCCCVHIYEQTKGSQLYLPYCLSDPECAHIFSPSLTTNYMTEQLYVSASMEMSENTEIHISAVHTSSRSIMLNAQTLDL